MSAAPRIVVHTIHENVTVATIEDSSMIDPTQIAEVKAVLFDLIDKQDRRKLILDMTKVQYLSSAALGVLIPLEEKYKKAKGSMVLVGVNESIMKLFTITCLDKLLKFAPNEAKALSILGVAV